MVQVHIGKKVKILLVLVFILLLASIWDFYRGKIPNILVMIGCFCGILRLIHYQNVFYHIPGILFPIIVLYPLFKIGVLGAGDIKLFSLLGFYFTFMESIFCIFTAFVLGAIVSLISFVRFDNFLERMTYLFSYLKECFSLGHFRYYYSNFKEEKTLDYEVNKTKIHLAIPIFVAVLFRMRGGVL